MEVFLCLVLLVGMLLAPEAISAGAEEGVTLCLQSVIPGLLPMLTVSAVLTALAPSVKLPKQLRSMAAQFGLPSSAVTVLPASLLGGYPAGISAVCNLYTSGQVTKSQAEAMAGFLCCASPSFFLGMLSDTLGKKLAFLLWAIQVTSALLVGLLFLKRNANPCMNPPNERKQVGLAFAFSQGLQCAIASMLTICACVIFFSAVTALLPSIPGWGGILLCGSIELTGSVADAAALPMPWSALFVSLLCAWGGLCVHAQNITILRRSGLRCRRYFVGKALHLLLSGMLTMACLPLYVNFSAVAFIPKYGILMLIFSVSFLYFRLFRKKTGNRAKIRV